MKACYFLLVLFNWRTYEEASRLQLGLSVRLSVKSHLTSGASDRPENTITYVKQISLKPFGCSDITLLPALYGYASRPLYF